jgi:hypothetical protein
MSCPREATGDGTSNDRANDDCDLAISFIIFGPKKLEISCRYPSSGVIEY